MGSIRSAYRIYFIINNLIILIFRLKIENPKALSLSLSIPLSLSLSSLSIPLSLFLSFFRARLPVCILQTPRDLCSMLLRDEHNSNEIHYLSEQYILFFIPQCIHTHNTTQHTHHTHTHHTQRSHKHTHTHTHTHSSHDPSAYSSLEGRK